MEKAFVKYCAGAFTYGLVRTVAYAPPRKKVDRVVKQVEDDAKYVS